VLKGRFSYRKMSSSVDKKLVSFLRELADKIDAEALSIEQLQHVGEFHINYITQNITNESSTNYEDISDMDLIKFVSLGLYMYKYYIGDKNTSI
jgi:hypothetical protein